MEKMDFFCKKKNAALGAASTWRPIYMEVILEFLFPALRALECQNPNPNLPDLRHVVSPHTRFCSLKGKPPPALKSCSLLGPLDQKC